LFATAIALPATRFTWHLIKTLYTLLKSVGNSLG
jgi:hypothetical protein